MLNPQRTIDELKELRSITGDENGAQRVAFTPIWEKSRKWLREKLKGVPVEIHDDAAGNTWATLKGKSDRALLMGGHIDSVPNGGWLDGCLNVMAGVEVLRRIAGEGTPPVTIRLVNWADEEARASDDHYSDRQLFQGALDPAEVGKLKDRYGITLSDALKNCNIDINRVLGAQQEKANAAAYLELHIEQGPVLLSKNLPMGAVLGTFGVERHQITFTGQAAHSGSTPMEHRKDALAGVSRLHLAIREIAVKHGGVCTVGSVKTEPGIVTSVVASATMTLDQRHLDANKLAAMYKDAKAASEKFAKEEKIGVEWKTLWQIQPFPFHPELIEMADEAIKETCGTSHRLPSGPLHDAAEVCRTGIPTIMLFVQSLHGISHNKIEDTKEEHIAMSVQALDKLASKTIRWIEAKK